MAMIQASTKNAKTFHKQINRSLSKVVSFVER